MRLDPLEQDVHAVSTGSAERTCFDKRRQASGDLIGQASGGGDALQLSKILLRRKLVAALKRGIDAANDPSLLAFLTFTVGGK